MTPPTIDHPALALLADSLRATQGPAAPEDIAKILGHALEATGYELAPKGELDQLRTAVRAAAIARVVAEYWRDAAMASDDPGVRVIAHPLACALDAFEGETEPKDLGVRGDHPAADAIRALTARRDGTAAS